MRVDDALSEASDLRRLLTDQIKRSEELAEENKFLRSIIAATVFDLGMVGRIDSSTENALRAAAKREQR